MLKITGCSIIGGIDASGTSASFRAIDPTHGTPLEPLFHGAGQAEIEQACLLADAAFDRYRNLALERRALFLEAISNQIAALGDTLILRAMAESGLPRMRLEGERARTIGQLKLFAQVVREGSFIDARIDSALPERQPPRPDLRYRMIGLGPVAVFGASNFPLAFSVAGGDTASALAAGCPVVVKAHPAHPGTSELVARAIVQAAVDCDMPAGVFSLLSGVGNDLGAQLVAHPVIQAVGFTGSRQGGTALMAIAARRAQPIPVYAEMSSINPVFLMPRALATRAENLGSALVASLCMGVGQFCTSPGIVLGIDGSDFTRFLHAAAQAVTAQTSATMLTPVICDAYRVGVERLVAQPGVRVIGKGNDSGPGTGVPILLATSSACLHENAQLREEVFGPVSILVACRDIDDMIEVAKRIEGQLTMTLQMDDDDISHARRLLPVLERKAGRVLVNGFPTGVEVADAMVHGGPYPATSDGRSTSVGTAAVERFLRPVCYQNFSSTLLPEALRDENPLGLTRRLDGKPA